MPKHEEYGELSTLALIGEASAAELRDLKDHLDKCPDCRQEYFEFVQFVLPQLSLAADGQPMNEVTAEDREAIRSAFLARAAKASVSFSDEAIAGRLTSAKDHDASFRKVLPWSSLWFRWGLAASLAVVLVAGALLMGRRSAPAVAVGSSKSSQTPPIAQTTILSSSNVSPIIDSQIAELRSGLKETIARLEKAKAALDASDRERATLQEELSKQNDLLKDTQEQKQSSEEARATLQGQLDRLQQKESVLQAEYADQTAAVVELADKLRQQKTAVEQNRRLAVTDSEVRDLMASRNLHIVDVFDTDTHGKTKPIFGRVFFAENKQLVFYAYDLNEVQGRDTKIDYHVWGQKEGLGRSPKSLGVFLADDRAQRRWVFKSDNEQLLSQIDSIFVTIEKSDSPKAEPKGQKLMYAYLRDHANHP